MKLIKIILIVSVLLGLSKTAFAFIVINEFLADVPLGGIGDANRDGIRSSAQDEFIEIVNWGNSEVLFSQWFIKDGSSVRHVFDVGTILGPYDCIVVFGGGTPRGFDVQAVTASSGGLSLNNDGDVIQLFDSSKNMIDEVVFGPEANNDQSLSRYPDGKGVFKPHSEIIDAQGFLFSPGKRVDGAPFASSTVPEPTHCFLFGLGAIFHFVRKHSKKG